MLSEKIAEKLERVRHRVINEMRQSGEAALVMGFHEEEGEALKESFFNPERIRKETEKAVEAVFKHGDVKLKVAYPESSFLFIVLTKK